MDLAARYHYPGALLLAVLLAAVHLLAPRIHKALSGHEHVIGSLGGGMAIAYVFLHLIPELEEGGHELGRMIYAVALGGFIVYYGLDVWLRRSSDSHGESTSPKHGFPLKLAQRWVYLWVIVYGTPALAAESGLRSIPVSLALGLHLAHAGLSLRSDAPRAFDRIGRYVLAAAPLAGWGAVVATRGANETFDLIIVAVLAGFLMQGVFGEELSESRQGKFRWFLLGAASFLVVVALARP
jgi:hypothetical protein